MTQGIQNWPTVADIKRRELEYDEAFAAYKVAADNLISIPVGADAVALIKERDAVYPRYVRAMRALNVD